MKLRGRCSDCGVCGENATLTPQLFKDFDYEMFTQSAISTAAPPKLNLLPECARISSKEYKKRILNGEAHVLLDVRPEQHFKITALPNSLNVPLSSLEGKLPEIRSALREVEEGKGLGSDSCASLYVVCRRGNDSQRAAHYLHQMGFTSARDIIGGLESWAYDVDPNFPIY